MLSLYAGQCDFLGLQPNLFSVIFLIESVISGYSSKAWMRRTYEGLRLGHECNNHIVLFITEKEQLGVGSVTHLILLLRFRKIIVITRLCLWYRHIQLRPHPIF